MKKLNKVVASIFGLITLYFLFAVFQSRLLPLNYLLIFMGIVLFVNSVLIIILLKVKHKIFKGLSLFFMFVITIIIIIGLRYSSSTLNFLRNISNLNFETTKYYGLALESSGHEEIDGLNTLIHNNMAKEMDELKDVLREKNVSFDETSDLTEIYNGLFDETFDAIVIESNFKDILGEELPEFIDDTVIIFEYEVRSELIRESRDVNVTEDPFNIYISGIDTRGNISNRARSDVNIIMTINPSTKEVLLTNIPRDYYVRIPGTTGYKDKLTHTGIYGVETSVSTVENLLDTEIDFYLRVNFSSTVRLIDALGGITVNSKYAFRTNDYSFTRGNNFMDGEKALAFVRERKNLPGGDRARGENQQAAIEGIINKMTQRDIITRYNSILNSMDGMFDTNMSSDDIVSLIRMQISDNARWDINQFSLNGTDSSNFTHSYSGSRVYVMEPDMETVEEAISLINNLMNKE